MVMQTQHLPQAVCYATARFWRAHAQHLRDRAQLSYLTGITRRTLEREAEAADRRGLDAASEE
jgi:hypothetical protein